MPAGSVTGWRPETNYMQSGLVDGQYVNAAYSMLASGPPRLANIGSAAALAGTLVGDAKGVGEIVHPMGLIQQIGLSHSKQFARLFEIGSERSYFIPGRTVGQLQLGRVYYHGATLLRLLYSYYQDNIGPTTVTPMLPSAAAAAMANPHDVIVPPGFENVFLNLGSDLFNQLIGLLWYIKDSNKMPMGAIYLEGCNIPNHSIQTDSQGLVFQESVSVQFERTVPVEIGGVPLISMANSGNAGGANTDFPGIELAHGHRTPSGHLGHRPQVHPVPRRSSGAGASGGGGPHLSGAERRPPRPQGGRVSQRGLRRGGCGGGQAGPGGLRIRHRRHHPRLRHRHRGAEAGGYLPGLQPHPGGGPGVALHQPHHRLGGPYASLGLMDLTDQEQQLIHRFGIEKTAEAKEAGVLDTMGRLAAAAVLIKMIDSSSSRYATRRAESMMERTMVEAREREALGPSLGGYHRGPRLFIPASGPAGVEPEDAALRYQMGFMPNVPAGMDAGMVRLASDEQEELAMRLGGATKTAAPAIFGQAATAIRTGAQRASNAVRGMGMKLAPPSVPKPGAFTSPAVSTPNPLVPAAPTSRVAPKTLKERVFGPAGGATKVKPEPAPAPKVEAKPATPAEANPAVNGKGAPGAAPDGEKKWGLGSNPLLKAGLGIGTGALLMKGSEKAIDYLQEEPPPTNFGQARYGAPRLSHGLNEYGQPQYGGGLQ